MKRGIGFGIGLILGALLGLGAGLVIAPERGRQRKRLARIKALRARRMLPGMGRTMTIRTQDLRQRLRAQVLEAQASGRALSVSDDVLIARIRARLEDCLEEPRRILVTARGGMVTVAGPILEHEVDAVIRCVQGVRGVRGLTNRLKVHRSRGSLPAS